MSFLKETLSQKQFAWFDFDRGDPVFAAIAFTPNCFNFSLIKVRRKASWLQWYWRILQAKH